MKPTRPYLSNTRPPVAEPPPPEPREPEPPRGRARRALGGLLEGGLAILLTILCCVVLLVVLTRLLPTATDLGDLLSTRQTPEAKVASSLDGSLGDLGEWKTISLLVLDNEVLHKDANSIAWLPAKSGATLTEGDGLQTTREGMAVVEFDGENRLRIGRNSLVIVHRPEKVELSGTPPAVSFTLVSGEMWGSFRHRGTPVQVELPSIKSTIRVDMGAQASRFKVNVREDKSTAIAVYQGDAQLDRTGRAEKLKPHEYVIVDSAGTVSAPRALLGPPDLLEPRTDERRLYREFPPRIAFRWRSTGADEYRIVISRDPELRQVEVDERTTNLSYPVGGLTAGDYWWSVTSLKNGVDGWPPPPRRLEIVEDRVPPVLQVQFPEVRTESESLAVTGNAEPGVEVFVAGKRAFVQPDGRFQATAPLNPGVNLVVVEAVDAAGNTTYSSKEIQRTLTEGGKHP